MMNATVKRIDDFQLTGDGSAPAWSAAEWLSILPIKGKSGAATRAKVACSSTGIYCLFDCEDHLLNCSSLKDGDDLWNEDVVEAFFWPDENQHLYLEYELSPLGKELLLLVPNDGGKFMGWGPWHYEGDRRARRATSVRGGPKTAGASITGWSAEFFIPFTLMIGLRNVPPVPGTQWRANFYRIDYDDPKQQTLFAWSTGVTDTFHDFNQFGTLTFA
jgi:hypothetical protein